MSYAQVVVGLPIEGPFDYLVPAQVNSNIGAGIRVRVGFGNQTKIGYVVKLSSRTKIKSVKPILEIIDRVPVLDKNMLLLTKELSEYYGASWGEAICSALPDGLRRGRKLPQPIIIPGPVSIEKGPEERILLHDCDGRVRFDAYVAEIKKAISLNQGVIVLFPDLDFALKFQALLQEKHSIPSILLHRQQPNELEAWFKIKEGAHRVIVGTRSAIFAPVYNLGLIIVDEEDNSIYKQEQLPHYHAREVAFMRSKIEKAKLLLGSNAPSLECMLLAREKKIEYRMLQRSQDFPEIILWDTKNVAFADRKRNIIFSKYLQDVIMGELNASGKVLLFVNRKGFATNAVCNTCHEVLRCPRCSVNLIYHFEDKLLRCHYCNFKMAAPNICPKCNSGYIRYSGLGTEKVESELARILPQARLARLDSQKTTDADNANLYIATSAIFKAENFNFDLVVVLAIDNTLNRADFRASEKGFSLLQGLLGLTAKKLIIQTSLASHHAFRCLIAKDPQLFYETELKQRRQAHFPPFRHFSIVRLRGRDEVKVKNVCQELFEQLKQSETKGLNIISLNPSFPLKLRGNYYWQILISSTKAEKISSFLKKHLRNLRHSGIIVSVDIDPV